jgi:hypothetical protein
MQVDKVQIYDFFFEMFHCCRPGKCNVVLLLSHQWKVVRYWMLDPGCWMLDAGCWMLDAGCWMKNSWIFRITFWGFG